MAVPSAVNITAIRIMNTSPPPTAARLSGRKPTMTHATATISPCITDVVAPPSVRPIMIVTRGTGAHRVGAGRRFRADRRAGQREERLLERVGPGLRLELGGRALGDDLAVIDDRDALRDALRFFHVVRRQENGDALALVQRLH